MAIIRIEYRTQSYLASCSPNESELQAGEKVKLTHNGADPLWDEIIVGHLAQPAFDDCPDRVYLIDFDDAQLNGGANPTYCDLDDPVCWSCCDINAELIEANAELIEANAELITANTVKLDNLINAFVTGGLITDNGDGTFTLIP